jgi:pimeloyl-ACP methyl ester carboxylesterase
VSHTRGPPRGGTQRTTTLAAAWGINRRPGRGDRGGATFTCRPVEGPGMARALEWLRDRVRPPGGDEAAPDLSTLCESIADDPRTVSLSDGRDLGYADCGDPDGDPLVVFHGFPNSRVFGALFDAAGREHGVRILAPERPGIGVSDPDPGRTLLDWPGDVAEFLDAVSLDRAPVLGVSGGGPYALACAHATPDRTPRVGVAVGLAPVSSVGLRDRLPFLLARFVPPLVRLQLYRDGRQARGDPEAALADRAEMAAPADGDYWRGEVGRALLESGLEARRQGNGPLVDELAIYGRPWGFDLGEIDVPVALWYGRDDRIVPVEMGFHLARAVPTAESHFYPGLGHVSAVERNEEPIVRWLLER